MNGKKKSAHVISHWIPMSPNFLDTKTCELSQMLDSCLLRGQGGSILLIVHHSDEYHGPEASSSLLKFYWEGLSGDCWVFFFLKKRGSGNKTPLLCPSEVPGRGCDYKVTWSLWGGQLWEGEEQNRSIKRVLQLASCENIPIPASGHTDCIRPPTSCCPTHTKGL